MTIFPDKINENILKLTTVKDRYLCVVVHKYIYRNVYRYFTILAPVKYYLICQRYAEKSTILKMLKCASKHISRIPTAVCASHLHNKRIRVDPCFQYKIQKRAIFIEQAPDHGEDEEHGEHAPCVL